MSLSPSSTGNLIFGLLISGISSCLTSLNFWTTILNLRSYYLTLKTMPLFPWALLITGGMLLLTLPILSGALLMVLADLHSNTLFFDPIFGGDPIFYQHLFWFFGHPEVYILIIPAFGIISIIISGILQKIIFSWQLFYLHLFYLHFLSSNNPFRNSTNNNGFSLSSFFYLSLSFLWIGAQFPQEKFLSYGRILTLYYYFLLMCILFSNLLFVFLTIS